MGDFRAHVLKAIDTKLDEVNHPLRAMLPEGQPRIDDDLNLRMIAWALCADAQVTGYDHGAGPTMIRFDTPFPHCPRHLGIALAVRSRLSRYPNSARTDLDDFDPRRTETRG